jgi:hypothetical protein
MGSGRVAMNLEIDLLFKAYDIWDLLIIAAIILGFISFIIRFSRSTGVMRQQLKWFVLGMSTIPASLVFDRLAEQINTPLILVLNNILDIVSIIAFPLVILIAITRYRLYDIDFIIRRTLLYSALTVALGLIYYGLVLVMQAFFAQRLGEQPEILIVISTLLIAALFQPLRRRFQLIIDRRFYRSKYDAEQTMQTFAARLQNEVNMQEISRSFVDVIDENFQPEQVWLWVVREAPKTK